MTVRVVVADDSYLLREAVSRLIDGEDDFELVGCCGNRDDLLAMVDDREPDVVVTDIRMPPTGTDEGVQVATRLRTSHPSIGVVVLSQYSTPAYAITLLEGGSAGRAYLLKDGVARADQLASAIRAVASGGSVIDPKVVEEVVNTRSQASASPLDRLTPRELEILSEIAQGKSNGAIATTLVLSERAVEKHINSILSKLHLNDEPDVNRRVKAVLVYLAQGAGRP
jgi:DNA-binding NarL/FixJ family response regulator